MITCPNCKLVWPGDSVHCPRCLDGPWRITVEATGKPRTRQAIGPETYTTPWQAGAVLETIRPELGQTIRIARMI